MEKDRQTNKQTNKQKDRQTDRQTEHSFYSLKNFQFQLITDNLFKISMALACTMNLLRCNWENDSCFDLNFMLFCGDRNILAMTKEIWANFGSAYIYDSYDDRVWISCLQFAICNDILVNTEWPFVLFSKNCEWLKTHSDSFSSFSYF